MKYSYLECSCTSDEHTVRFAFEPHPWPDDFPKDREVYVTVFLAEHGFWKRLWHGIKYIFGHKCQYGHFEETLLTNKQIEELRDLCNEILEVE